MPPCCLQGNICLNNNKRCQKALEVELRCCPPFKKCIFLLSANASQVTQLWLTSPFIFFTNKQYQLLHVKFMATVTLLRIFFSNGCYIQLKKRSKEHSFLLFEMEVCPLLFLGHSQRVSKSMFALKSVVHLNGNEIEEQK